MKLGRRPARQSPSRVNWLTTRTEPPTSSHGQVHLAGLVLERPEPDDLLGQAVGVLVGIPFGDPEQDKPADADPADDLALDLDRRAGDSLEHGPHSSSQPD